MSINKLNTPITYHYTSLAYALLLIIQSSSIICKTWNYLEPKFGKMQVADQHAQFYDEVWIAEIDAAFIDSIAAEA